MVAVKPSLWIRLDTVARQLTPFLLTMLAVLVTVLPLQLPNLGMAGPVWPLMAVFYWGLYRPDLMPPAAVFVAGLMLDVLSGAPIGVNTLSFLLVHGVVAAQRRFFYGKPYAIVWLGFAFVSAGAFLASWLLASAWHGTMVAPRMLIFQFLLTVGCFPLLSWALLAWQRLFLRHV